MITLEQLPPKGVKREQAILELGKEEANGELLFQLVNTEKGKCKTAAQKALAQLEYAPAAPLWAKLVKGKWMGSHIMSDTCSDCVSEQIAPVILKTLSQLLDEGDTKPLEIEQLNFCFHLMLGKASPKMLEVYRFLAENIQRIAQLKRAPAYLKGLEPEEWHNEQEKVRQLMPYKLPARLVEYLKTGPLRLEFPDQKWVKWAELYSYMDVQEMTWKRKKLLSLMAAMDNYSDYLLLWSPRDKKLWYLDIEHEEFHPLAKWDDFIADPGRYLNGMIEGEFEE